MTIFWEFFTFSWPLRGMGGGQPLFPIFFGWLPLHFLCKINHSRSNVLLLRRKHINFFHISQMENWIITQHRWKTICPTNPGDAAQFLHLTLNMGIMSPLVKVCSQKIYWILPDLVWKSPHRKVYPDIFFRKYIFETPLNGILMSAPVFLVFYFSTKTMLTMYPFALCNLLISLSFLGMAWTRAGNWFFSSIRYTGYTGYTRYTW